jgi:LAGLIDADG DNA endonuclease family
LTRAYFTAATCAISFNKSLSVITPLLFFKRKIFNKIYSTLTSNINNKKELTIWNKQLGFSSLNNISKINNLKRNMIKLTPRIKSIIIGLLLSDGWLQQHYHWNPRLGFKQSINNFNYLWYIFNEMSYLCSNLPYKGKSIIRGKLFYNISFQTRQLKCLNEMFNLFYNKVNGINKKTIKYDLIHYIDYRAIANWIMGDGSKRKKGIILCTDSFSIKEVILLNHILIIKFNLNSTIQKEKKFYRIYISGKDLMVIKPYILPYFVDHFLYKIS